MSAQDLLLQFPEDKGGLPKFAVGEAKSRPVRLELSAGEVAFMLCGFISRYGESALRSAIDSIVGQDPTVKHVVLTEPAQILTRGQQS